MTIPGTMTLAELQKLVAESKGEWEHLEFTKTTGELHGGMETLCAFLNGAGGKVLFGVTNAGRIARQEDAINTGEIEWTGRILSCLLRGMPWEREWRTTMQTTLAVEDIKLTLPELLDSLAPGD